MTNRQTPQPISQEIPSMKKTIPIGVKLIAILYYIGAVISVLMGILFIVAGGTVAPLISDQVQGLEALNTTSFIFIGIFALIIGIIGFFIGRGLWKASNWAKNVVIIFSILGVINSVGAMIGGQVISSIFNIAFNGLIAGYLLFSKSVKEAFAKTPLQ